MDMNGPSDWHTKRSKSEKYKYHMISLICGIQNMTQMNLSVKQKQTHRHREQTVVAKGAGGRGTDGVGVWD